MPRARVLRVVRLLRALRYSARCKEPIIRSLRGLALVLSPLARSTMDARRGALTANAALTTATARTNRSARMPRPRDFKLPRRGSTPQICNRRDRDTRAADRLSRGPSKMRRSRPRLLRRHLLARYLLATRRRCAARWIVPWLIGRWQGRKLVILLVVASCSQLVQ